MISIPAFNTVCNAASAIFVSSGVIFIKRRRIFSHKICMLTAFTASSVFLASYLIYHARHGAIHFLGTGWIRPIYLILLIGHTVLAIFVLPMVLQVLRLALQNRFDQHKRWARITWPLWMTVSLSGVLVYWFLYQFPKK